MTALDKDRNAWLPIPWTRPDVDLDDPAGLARLVERDRPDAVIHAAAWTDVDGCAREPAVAMRRNGAATAALATACAGREVQLVVISTNEVFDGLRTDGRGYRPLEEPAPGNPYGASKLAGEVAAAEAYAGIDAPLAIVRTAWLYGPPGHDFPERILDAAVRAAANGEALRLVADEHGNPTFAPDLAAALVAILAASAAGTFHVVNEGSASRAEWARAILEAAGVRLATIDVPAATWPRASTPPPRAILEPSPVAGAAPLRAWASATAAYVPELLAIRAARPVAAPPVGSAS
ncbi:MAG: NAD-dependent epimerase/dehydratase family protein [Chloroflexota bacterium]|nr:MAG: NAD-dependent epimerase/dehydratase family protein [Chloroflexota bacterium]